MHFFCSYFLMAGLLYCLAITSMIIYPLLGTHLSSYTKLCICASIWLMEKWCRGRAVVWLGAPWFVLPHGNGHWPPVRDLVLCEKTCAYLSCYQACFILTDTIKSLFPTTENTVITPKAKEASSVWKCVSSASMADLSKHFTLLNSCNIKGHLNCIWKYFSVSPSILYNKSMKKQ